MYYTDDPVRDFARYDAAQRAELAKLPRCANCGEPIQTEYMFDLPDGLWCENCINDARSLNEGL